MNLGEEWTLFYRYLDETHLYKDQIDHIMDKVALMLAHVEGQAYQKGFYDGKDSERGW